MIKLYSYGKINLFLDIIDKRNDGYHIIKTIMQSIDLHDEITIDRINENIIKIECNDKSIPTDFKNTCYKAALIIKQQKNINSGISIKINKNIPSMAGLAGGSGNSAALIKGMNKLFDLNLSQDEMLEIGLKIGADVPFCILGGTYLAEGIGEKLEKTEDFIWNNILIVKPDFNMSTAMVYKNLKNMYYNSHEDNKILQHIKSKQFLDVSNSIANTLEHVVENIHPEINDIKSLMLEHNAVSSMMTGSGSAIFGLYQNKNDLDKSYEIFKKLYPHTFKTRTINEGVEFIV